MSKQSSWFVTAVVVAVAGVVGCSTSVNGEQRDSGTTSGDASSDASDDGGVCPSAPPTKGDLDSAGGWKPPAPANTSACTPQDIKTFETNYQTAQTFADIVKGVPPGCASCLMGKESDASWPPIVTDETGEKGFANFGACYAYESGKPDCGKAIQYEEFCIDESCSACATSDLDACFNDEAMIKACDALFAADIQSACPEAQASMLDDHCSNIIVGASYLCSTGPEDAGRGAPDAGDSAVDDAPAD